MQAAETKPRSRTIVGIAIALWLLFTAIHTFNLNEPLNAILFFIPGFLGIGILVFAGFTLKQCYLRAAPLSRAGLVTLAVFSLILIPILLTGR